MKGNRLTGLFIAGVDTEVGKTYVGAVLAREFFSQGIRTGVYKPVASGCRRGPQGRLVSDDAVTLWEAAGRPAPIERVCPLRFEAPVAPPTAARALGQSIELDSLLAGARWWQKRCDLLLVEGAGGLLSPLGSDFDNRDFAHALGMPVVLVAANRLGVINAVRLTVEALLAHRPRPLEIHSIVISETQPASSSSDISRATNFADLEHWLAKTVTPVPRLRSVPYASRLTS